jgi:hypothetical protein
MYIVRSTHYILPAQHRLTAAAAETTFTVLPHAITIGKRHETLKLPNTTWPAMVLAVLRALPEPPGALCS